MAAAAGSEAAPPSATSCSFAPSCFSAQPQASITCSPLLLTAALTINICRVPRFHMPGQTYQLFLAPSRGCK